MATGAPACKGLRRGGASWSLCTLPQLMRQGFKASFGCQVGKRFTSVQIVGQDRGACDQRQWCRPKPFPKSYDGEKNQAVRAFAIAANDFLPRRLESPLMETEGGGKGSKPRPYPPATTRGTRGLLAVNTAAFLYIQAILHAFGYGGNNWRATACVLVQSLVAIPLAARLSPWALPQHSSG